MDNTGIILMKHKVHRQRVFFNSRFLCNLKKTPQNIQIVTAVSLHNTVTNYVEFGNVYKTYTHQLNTRTYNLQGCESYALQITRK